jgi:TPR repeat protein
MASVLGRLGFEVLLRENVTQKQMQRAIAEFGRRVTAGTAALFYYAGHGMQVGGKNYLIPVDAVVQVEADIRLETVDVDAVLDQVRENSLNLIILDACRNNPFERRFRSGSRGLATIEAPVGTLIAYATSPGKVAGDGEGPNGLYTGELVKAIPVPGLKVEETFKRVRTAVAHRTRNEQIPWESSSLMGDFYFAPVASDTPPTPSAPVSPPAALAAPGQAPPSPPPPAPAVSAALPPPDTQPRQAVVRECDELAGIRDPADSETREVSADTIDARRAVPACKQAVALMPGHPRYMAQYGRALLMARDDSEALVWQRRAADLGFPRALNNLGFMYANGRGLPKDEIEAVRWYRKGADQGDPPARNNLGWMYADGRGVGKDEAEAVRLFRLAADAGHARAQNSLGVMYQNGRGVPKDDAEAVRWYRKGADQGDLVAQNNLGWMYADGRGARKDEAEAVRLFRLAAAEGYSRAQNSLGFMYQNGRGAPKDEADAARWYRKAADQGLASAQNNLGLLYADGRGVSRDDSEAARLFRLAAEQGHARGQSNLGWMYEHSRGVQKDNEEAARLYRLSADQGDEVAKKNLQRICGALFKPKHCPR